MAYGRDRRSLKTGFVSRRSKKVGIQNEEKKISEGREENKRLAIPPPQLTRPAAKKPGKKKRGRKLLGMAAKTSKISITLSRTQYESWLSAARDEGCSLSAWVRSRVER